MGVGANIVFVVRTVLVFFFSCVYGVLVLGRFNLGELRIILFLFYEVSRIV